MYNNLCSSSLLEFPWARVHGCNILIMTKQTNQPTNNISHHCFSPQLLHSFKSLIPQCNMDHGSEEGGLYIYSFLWLIADWCGRTQSTVGSTIPRQVDLNWMKNLANRTWSHTPLSLALRRQRHLISVSSRLAWLTYRVPDWPQLHFERTCLKINNR